MFSSFDHFFKLKATVDTRYHSANNLCYIGIAFMARNQICFCCVKGFTDLLNMIGMPSWKPDHKLKYCLMKNSFFTTSGTEEVQFLFNYNCELQQSLMELFVLWQIDGVSELLKTQQLHSEDSCFELDILSSY